MADFRKLLIDRRLNMVDHADIIKSHLAYMKIEDPKMYEEYSKFYGVELEVTVAEDLQKKPIAKKIAPKKEEVKPVEKKRGRPSTK